MTGAIDVQIRMAECEDDVQGVAPLFDAYRRFYGAPPDPAGALAFLLERWHLRESVLFAAVDGSRALGFVQLYPLFLSVEMRRFWLLNDLYVDQQTRRAGVGRALMRRAAQHARKTHAAGLTLSTAIDNVTAQGLYESESYVRDDKFVVYKMTVRESIK